MSWYFYLYVMCVCVHVHMHMYMQGAHKARRGCWIPWNWSYKTLGLPRAASALVSRSYNMAVTAAVWFLSSELTALRSFCESLWTTRVYWPWTTDSSTICPHRFEVSSFPLLPFVKSKLHVPTLVFQPSYRSPKTKTHLQNSYNTLI